MKLFLLLLFQIFMPLLEDHVNISFIQCLTHFWSSVFSQIPSWYRCRKNQILRMRINLLRIRKHWSRFWLIISRNILWSIQGLFFEMLPLIPSRSTNSFLKISVFKEPLFLWKQSFLLKGSDYTVNGNVIPCCLHDPSLPMKHEDSKSHLRSKLPTMKFVCTKSKIVFALPIANPRMIKRFMPICFL